ncbi:iron ABC transporter permease [Simiduia litorea]|uniref:FecCD family ABC transporter permease n=1 Tax=Simiduia litorea TaxID=1435348 RepID=UPI0036F2D6F2
MYSRLPLISVYTCLLLLLGASLVASITIGAMSLPAWQGALSVVDALLGSQWSQLTALETTIVLELRLPRLILALLTGALLAQCGAVMQGLFRNPLADPGIIGVSSGAALGAACAITLGAGLAQFGLVSAAAFLGGLITTWLIYRLSHTRLGTSVFILLLAGVAISAFTGAAIGFLSYFSNDQQLRTLSLWQMGSLTGASLFNLWPLTIVTSLLMVFFQQRAQALNALLLGEAEAQHLGISVEKLKRQLIAATALGVGISVAHTGIIGFIGLIVPHLVRMLCGPCHRRLLPISALMGALLLACADLVARTLVAPAELPVGLLTALIGAPFFLFLLLSSKRDFS